MEKLTINIPENKSTLVKQILKGLGVTILQESHITNSEYKKKLASVSTWSEEEVKVLEENKNAFQNFKPEQW